MKIPRYARDRAGQTVHMDFNPPSPEQQKSRCWSAGRVAETENTVCRLRGISEAHGLWGSGGWRGSTPRNHSFRGSCRANRPTGRQDRGSRPHRGRLPRTPDQKERLAAAKGQERLLGDARHAALYPSTCPRVRAGLLEPSHRGQAFDPLGQGGCPARQAASALQCHWAPVLPDGNNFATPRSSLAVGSICPIGMPT